MSNALFDFLPKHGALQILGLYMKYKYSYIILYVYKFFEKLKKLNILKLFIYVKKYSWKIN